MSEIENYKTSLREIRLSLPMSPWPENLKKQILLSDKNAKYFPAVKWGMNNGIVDNKVIRYQECGGWNEIVFFSYPLTLQGEEFLKADNEKQLKLATDEAVKSVGNQIGKWGILGFVMLVLLIIFYFLNEYFSIV